MWISYERQENQNVKKKQNVKNGRKPKARINDLMSRMLIVFGSFPCYNFLIVYEKRATQFQERSDDLQKI